MQLKFSLTSERFDSYTAARNFGTAKGHPSSGGHVSCVMMLCCIRGGACSEAHLWASSATTRLLARVHRPRFHSPCPRQSDGMGSRMHRDGCTER